MKKFLVSAVILVCVFTLSVVYSVSVQENLSENLTRLHIVANSNLPLDQSIKYRTRDRFLDYVAQNDRLPDIVTLSTLSNNYLAEIGAPYEASVSYEKCYVPKKDYKSIVLPQGEYNCIKVTLGDGDGENWWCIAYPPLCYTESMFGELSENGIKELSQMLDSETLSAITKGKKLNFRLKIVDEIQRLISKK